MSPFDSTSTRRYAPSRGGVGSLTRLKAARRSEPKWKCSVHRPEPMSIPVAWCRSPSAFTIWTVQRVTTGSAHVPHGGAQRMQTGTDPLVVPPELDIRTNGNGVLQLSGWWNWATCNAMGRSVRSQRAQCMSCAYLCV